MTKSTRRIRLYGYAMIIMVIASCGHERPFNRRYASISYSEQNKTQDIPWVASPSATKEYQLFADVPAFLSSGEQEEKNGASQNNIRSEREIWANIVASMPYAMPFYCDPACYEASIILALQDCQPYIFALFYFYQNPPPKLYGDDDALIAWEYGDRPLLNKSYALRRPRGYCQGR